MRQMSKQERVRGERERERERERESSYQRTWMAVTVLNMAGTTGKGKATEMKDKTNILHTKTPQIAFLSL